MSDTKFQPGPYRVHPYSIRDGRNVRFEIIARDTDGEEYVVARTPDDGSRVGEATAYLLAAAPDLYAALESIALGLTNGQKERGETVESIARAALSKAEGGAK